MAIASYETLVAAASEWLARDQDTVLINRIPDFFTLAEAKFNRTLFVRQMETRSTTTVDMSSNEPEFISLPTDFQSMRRIRLSSVAGKPSLQFLSGTQMDEMRTSVADVSDAPRYFSILGNEIELFPTPAAVATIEMVYRANLTPLNVDNVSNWLLQLAPDLYLYGALLQAAPYIKQDSRIQVWAAAVQSALIDLNALGSMSAFNAGPLQVRVG